MSRSVHLFNFYGVAPKKDDSLLTASGAMLAQDVDLSKGDLEPFRVSPLVSTGTEKIVTGVVIQKGNCLFKTWNYHTDVDYGRPESNDVGMLYWIENNSVMYAPWQDVCNDIAHVLGVPAPTSAPVFSAVTGSTYGCKTVSSFCYTNVGIEFQESAPSPPSVTKEMNASDGAKVTLPAAPAGIVGRNIYRTMGGSTTGSEQAIIAGGEWVLVAEVGTNAAEFNTNGLESVAEILPSTRWGLPPQNPTSLSFISGSNVLMVAKGNVIHVSQPGQYHAFPHDRDITLKDNVVSIREYDGDIIVLTDGHPYIITPINEREGASHYNVLRAEESYPCVSPQSVSVGTTGVVWASTDGAFVIGRSRAGLSVQSLTSDIFHSRDWKDSDPSTIRAEIHNGSYYFTSSNPITNSITKRSSYTWVLSYDETVYQNPINIHLISLSVKPDAWFRSRTDKLYYSLNNKIYEWDPSSGTDLLPYDYISRDIVEQGLTNYSAAKVVNDGDGDLSFQIYREEGANDVLLYSRTITHSDPFRLPRTNLSVDHFIRLVGTSRVRRIHLASSLYDLTESRDTTFTHGNSRLTSR